MNGKISLQIFLSFLIILKFEKFNKVYSTF